MMYKRTASREMRHMTAIQIYPSTGTLDAPLMSDEEWSAMTLEQQAQQTAFESKFAADCKKAYDDSSVAISDLGVNVISNQKTPERHKLWVEIYEREMAKPQWECGDPVWQQKRIERDAMLKADIKLFYMKDAK